MTQREKFRHLATDCPVLIAITGNPAEGRFELALTTEPVEELLRRADFVGLVGIKGLKTQAAFAVELDDAAVQTLSQLFARLMEGAINRVEY
jgi:hypothetical protein